MTLFIQLLLAHLIGDFFLQTKSAVEKKRRRKLRSPALYGHVAIHVGLVLLIVGVEHWVVALVLGAAHFAIDAFKLLAQTEQTLERWFFIDQGLHVISIFAIAYGVAGFPYLVIPDTWLPAAVALVFLTRPSAFFVGMAMARWTRIIERDGDPDATLPRAGQYIGILERVMIFAFIALGQWGAIGFLMAAKSIFRFGDLTRAKDRKLTEYILIGTFLSFGMAITAGLLYRSYVVFIGS